MCLLWFESPVSSDWRVVFRHALLSSPFRPRSMSHFLLANCLTFYPPSNLNRGEDGRPKTALVGGEPRIKISPAALKSAWRLSSMFKGFIPETLLGTRTLELGREIFETLKRDKELSDADAARVTRRVIAVMTLTSEQKRQAKETKILKKIASAKDDMTDATSVVEGTLAFFTPAEIRRAHAAASRVFPVPAPPVTIT